MLRRASTALFCALALVAPAYSQDFQTMANDTGCQSRFSDDKKADIFATKYKGREITVTGEVQVLGSDRIGLRLLRSSTMSDVSIKLANPKEAYDLEKGQTVTIRFVPTDAGGCILPYYGDRGVISSKR